VPKIWSNRRETPPGATLAAGSHHAPLTTSQAGVQPTPTEGGRLTSKKIWRIFWNLIVEKLVE